MPVNLYMLPGQAYSSGELGHFYAVFFCIRALSKHNTL